ncbi:MAG: colicin immunity protein Cui [Hafnia alvei]|uniref:colicin immunity protein Cui n=1 Tax=Hafnia alvei TaxID=569 RepID=UPI002907EE21|nr:colicin immunity protein Cui [Hafnia alvei]MDU7483723.1 colicin immunity protein Cui [Hafnia alvei]
MKVNEKFEEGNRAAKKMLYALLILIVPILILSGLYIINPSSYVFYAIYDSTKNLPAILSQNNLLLSKSMDIYTKTAPLMAFFVFLLTYKKLCLRNDVSFLKITFLFLLFTIIEIIIIYVFLFTNTELTTSSKLFRLMSENNLFLLFFYISLYAGIYIFSYLYLWFCVGTFRAFKERQ